MTGHYRYEPVKRDSSNFGASSCYVVRANELITARYNVVSFNSMDFVLGSRIRENSSIPRNQRSKESPIPEDPLLGRSLSRSR